MPRVKLTLDPGDFTLSIEHGRVEGSKTWSETRVSGGSSGGGGFVSGGSGYVSSPGVTISSTVRTRNTFFLKSNDGKQTSADIDGAMPLCDGQLVSIVYVRRTRYLDSYPLIIYNHSTGEITERRESFNAAAKPFGLSRGLTGIILAVLAGLLFGMAADSLFRVPIFEIAMPIAALFLVTRMSRSFSASLDQLISDAKLLAVQSAAHDSHIGP